MASGEPVGSRALSKMFDFSPATIRNVMADLEDLGLVFAPHVSAGRLPTDLGLRLFVDGLMEKGLLSETDRAALEQECRVEGASIDTLLEKASETLSGLSASAGLVVAPKSDKAIKHIEFILLEPTQALVVIVPEDGIIENRLMTVPPGMTPDILKKAGMFLSERLYGRSMANMRAVILEEINARQAELGELTTKAIEAGLALQAGDGKLIVRGRSHLVSDDLRELEHIRLLMEQLEAKETISKLLEEASQAGGVKIYIGAENPIFQRSGYAMILTPYTSGASNSIVGAVGVIGPARLNYAKIIPSVNYMAEMISRRIRGLSEGSFATKS